MASVIPEAIYAGTYFPAFGHFFTETVPNLAAVADFAQQTPNVPILMHLNPEMSGGVLKAPELTGWADWFHQRTGVPFDRLKFITEPLVIKQMFIPPSPFRRKFRYASDTLLPLLDKFFSAPAGTDEKVYFSRARWPRPRVIEEKQIEERLSSMGYVIIHPQELSLDEQLSVIRGAKSLVGPQGTALHWSLFSEQIEQVVSLGWPSPLQKGICIARGQQYQEFKGKRPKGSELRVRSVSVDRLEQFLNNAAT